MSGSSSINILIRGEPTAMARVSRSWKGGLHAFTPAKQKNAMQIVTMTAASVMGSRPPLEGALSVEMVFSYLWPAKVPKSRRMNAYGHFREKRPDLDNLVKLVADACNGVVWRDDAQIVRLLAIKQYADVPAVSLTVTPIEGLWAMPIRTEEEVDAE